MITTIKDTTAQGIQQYQKSDPVRDEGAKPVSGGFVPYSMAAP